MSDFKAPNRKAPRFREKSKVILNKELFEAFLEKHPKYSSLSLKTFKEVVTTYNGKMWEATLSHRDGVKLPENLGYIVVAKCDKPKTMNTDWVSSIKHGKAVNYSNWDSDNYLAKICYSNFSMRYRFSDRELWQFIPTRNYKTAVSHNFAEMYNKYIHLTKYISLAKLYKK